jgi:hypothetical protein
VNFVNFRFCVIYAPPCELDTFRAIYCRRLQLKTFPSRAEAVHFVWRPFCCGRVVEVAPSNELGRRNSASSENGSISLTRRDSPSSLYSSMRRRSNTSRVAYAPVHGSSPGTLFITRCTSREALSALHAPKRGLTHPPPLRGSAAARAARASSAPSWSR